MYVRFIFNSYRCRCQVSLKMKTFLHFLPSANSIKLSKKIPQRQVKNDNNLFLAIYVLFKGKHLYQLFIVLPLHT
jgi:hypothetical protein